MGIFQDAHATVILADYISIDAAGKINALGAGFTVSGVQPTGLTPPQHAAAIIDVPAKYGGQECAVSLELRNETSGSAVQLPGPSGQPEALRVSQVVKAERANIPGVYLPESMFCRVQVVIGFPNGLPLAPGNLYAWRLAIDGQTRNGWHARFYVPGPPPPPVFGGPAGPADIPMPPPVS